MLVNISNDRMAELLEGVSGERRSLEFKEGFSWMSRGSQMGHIQATTIKTLLGLSNTPKGGVLIIGVTDNGVSQHDFVGVDDIMKASFQNTEAIASQLDSFATSSMDYELGIGSYDDKEYIVFTVSEFPVAPVQCAKECVIGNGKILQQHALYVRSSKALPSTIMATPIELREIITMVEERDEQFIKRFAPIQSQVSIPTDIERYDALDGDLL